MAGAGEGVKVEGVRQHCCTGGIIQLALRIRRGCLRLSLSNHVSCPWRVEQEEEQEEGEKGEEGEKKMESSSRNSSGIIHCKEKKKTMEKKEHFVHDACHVSLP